MKIAVTSQNRREVTEHAGRCRKFWIYDIDDERIVDKQLLELPQNQSFHESAPHDPHPLDVADVLISGGMGQGMHRRLAAKGIIAIVTVEKDPDTAVSKFLTGKLAPSDNGVGCSHGGKHHAHHHGGC